ncbi:MAG: hypothetical protein ACI7YS_06980 [Flavobacterium sp.]
MKKTLIILAIFSCSLLFSQTKSETEEWITETYHKFNTINPNYDLYFENNYLYYRYIGVNFREMVMRVKVKDISKIEIRQEGRKGVKDYANVYIYFKKEKYQLKFDEDDSFTTHNVYTKFAISITPDLIKDGYKKRMEKAFIHLVKLNGGNASVKQEAF